MKSSALIRSVEIETSIRIIKLQDSILRQQIPDDKISQMSLNHLIGKQRALIWVLKEGNDEN